MRTFIAVLFCVLAFLALASAGKHGVDIDNTTFESKVANSPNVWVLEFYSEWCGGCEEFGPDWTRLVKRSPFSKSLKFGRVNIDEDAGDALFNKLFTPDDVVPNVKIFSSMSDKHGKSLGENIIPLAKLVKDLSSETKGLGTDGQGYFLKQGASVHDEL